jgi:hypothetical protein
MITVFHDSQGDDAHDNLQKWRGANERGYVINRKTASAGMLHRADCKHMGDFTWQPDGSAGLTGTEKICSVDRNELGSWAEEHQIRVTICNDCMRD